MLLFTKIYALIQFFIEIRLIVNESRLLKS